MTFELLEDVIGPHQIDDRRGGRPLAEREIAVSGMKEVRKGENKHRRWMD